MRQRLKLSIILHRDRHPILFSLTAEHVVGRLALMAIAHSLRLCAVQRVFHDRLGQERSQGLSHGNFDVLSFPRVGPVVKGF